MSDPYCMRTIQLDELDQLLALYAHLHATDDALPEAEVLRERWEEFIADPRMRCFVVELHGELIASCTLAIIPNMTRGTRPYGLIENVVTHRLYRRQGYGRAVLQAALEHAWQQGCYKVMLLTGSKQEATLHFYEGAGFQRGVKTGFVAYP